MGYKQGASRVQVGYKVVEGDRWERTRLYGKGASRVQAGCKMVMRW